MKSRLQLTALTMGLALVAASAANAQNLTLPQFLSMGGTGEINQVPQITYPSVDGFTWVDLADYVAPVANFTGFRLNGTAIAPADLIPLRSTSFTLVDPATGVASSVLSTASNGLTKVGSDVQLGGTLTHATSIGQAGNTLSLAGGNVSFQPPSTTSPLVVELGDGNYPRLYSSSGFTLQSGPNIYQMHFSPSGNIGIGTASAVGAKLVVGGSSLSTVGGLSSYLVSGDTLVHGGAVPGTLVNASIYAVSEILCATNIRATGAVQAIQAIVASDVRIKNVIGQSSSVDDLKLLEKIKIVDYTMKDSKLMGSAVIKKVIAQDVEQVYPNAVTKVSNYLPDVMEQSQIRSKGNGQFEIQLTKTPAFKVGDQVKILTATGDAQFPLVKSVIDNLFTVELTDLKNDEVVFVYGHEVKDFRTVDYDALSMLNISATQELAKKVTALEAENAELKKLAAEMKQIKALVAALEDKANGIVTVSLTK